MKGLFPELGEAGEQYAAETIVLCEQRPFHLTMEDDELLSQQGAFSSIRLQRLRVRSEKTPDIKDRVAGLAYCLIYCWN